MDEATLERRLHLNMTLIGGFMVGYGVINRHDILGSAQTGNMVSLAMDAVGHADEEWFFRIIALIIYVASVSLTVILSHKISKMSQKRLSILIDGAVLLIIGFYPAEMNPFVALFPIFFATALDTPDTYSKRDADAVLRSTPTLFTVASTTPPRASDNCF